MTRAYHLIRYIPDPLRGEMVNIALVALVDGHARVMALPATEVTMRAFRIAPHVETSNAVAFVNELVAVAGDITAVGQLLEVFDTHFRIEEPRRLSGSVDIEATLAGAFRELVAQPAKRRRTGERSKWTLDRALNSVSGRVPTFAAHALRSVENRPTVI